MSRKHNTKHNRSRSRYQQRLAARGLSKDDGGISQYCRLAESSARDADAMRSVIRRLLDGWSPFGSRWTVYDLLGGDGGVPDEPMSDAERAVIDDITATSSGEGE